MSSTDDILSIFTELERSGAFEDALARAVHLACEITGGSAALLAVDGQSMLAHGWSITYDPQSLICASSRPFGDEPLSSQPRPGMVKGRSHPITAGATHVQVALRCGVESVGTLTLWAPHGANLEEIKALLRPLDTVLAVLMAAVSGVTVADGLLSRTAFRNRVRSEIARAQRLSEEFCVLHIRLSGSPEHSTDGASSRWTTAVEVGKILHPRLRTSDSIGLMAPDRLAILLTTTSSLGARIAQRRIEHVLSNSVGQSAVTRTDAASLEFHIESYADGAGDVDNLCHPNDSTQRGHPRGEYVETFR